MKRLLAGGLGWSLAWLVATAAGDESPRQVPRPWPPAPVQGQLVGASTGQVLGVRLGRPEPLQAANAASSTSVGTTSGLQLASYRAVSGNPMPTAIPEPGRFAIPEPIADAPLQRKTASTRIGSDFASERGAVAPASGLSAVEPAGPPSATSPNPAGTSVWNGGPIVVGEPTAGDADVIYLDDDAGDGFDVRIQEIPPHRWYLRAEYLLWWIRDPEFPILATTGPVASQGILGNPGTTVLFGGDSVGLNPFSGARFTLGWWFDDCQQKGIEGNYFFLGQQAIRFTADSNTFPVLTRPFFNLNEGREDAQITAAPGLATGGLVIDAPSKLQGAELNLRCNLCCGCCGRLDFLAGVRFLELDEALRITEVVQVLPNAPVPNAGALALVVDEFNTRNQFYGGQLGLDYERQRNRWLFNLRSKLALGVTRQLIDINGFQVVRLPTGVTQTFVGGLLALPSNIGHSSRNRFSVVPEVGINIGYQLTDALILQVGYSVFFWTNVVRPGDQVDRVLDINQIPNFRRTVAAAQVRPVVPFKETTFWAHGMNVGLEYRY